MKTLFLKKIKEAGYTSVAFTGMTKNVGKTTALNYMLHECFLDNCRAGIVSIGRDGERRDSWSGAEKPRIRAPENTLVASAHQALNNSKASLEIIENTGITTALGSVYLARVRRSGYVEIATTPSVQKIKRIIDAMRGLGAELVLVDGAVDRVSLAAPGITDCTLLSTGASVHRQLDVVVRKTAARVQQLLIPGVTQKDSNLPAALLDSTKQNRSALIFAGHEDYYTINDQKPLEYDKTILRYLKDKEIKAVYIDGAVLDSVLKTFISCSRELAGTLLLVRQGTNIIVDEKVWNNYLKVHGYIRAVNPVRLLGVTANPVSPRGESFFFEDLVAALARGLKGLNLTVVDLIAGVLRHSG